MHISKIQPQTPLQQPHMRRSVNQRIDALATLPVFFKLQGRRVVILGGTEAAVWKSELALAAGADVEVVSDCFDPAFSSLPHQDRLHLREKVWETSDLWGAAFVIADAQDTAEAERVQSSARAAGVALNVIDRPDFCDFQFGAIVNRSPVIVSISTDGAAPVLGQEIRKRIEALLPRQLGQWGALAKALRKTVGTTFASGQERRSFWRHFAQKAFQRSPTEQDHRVVLEMPRVLDEPTTVKIDLADPKAITLRDIEALQAADRVCGGVSIPEEIRSFVRREATWNTSENGCSACPHSADFKCVKIRPKAQAA
jgi:uroporphyrin-III C-methyltransferase/precorrin-2 dehydrogenase/sirohydrochlorin ferrochelatase